MKIKINNILLLIFAFTFLSENSQNDSTIIFSQDLIVAQIQNIKNENIIAKIYSDYHSGSKVKWLIYGIAPVTTRATAFMRLRGSEHFPSDILLGTATGALAGIVVPQYHKTKSNNKSGMRILPFSTGEINGLVIT